MGVRPINRAANLEFSAAVRQSGPKITKRTTRSRPAKTVRMAAVHYVAPFAGLITLDYVYSKGSKQTEKRKQATFSKMAMQHKTQAPGAGTRHP